MNNEVKSASPFSIDRDTAFRAMVLLIALGILAVLFHDRIVEPWQVERNVEFSDAALDAAATSFTDTIWSLELSDHLRPAVPDRENIAHWAEAGAAALVDDAPLAPVLDEIAADPSAPIGLGADEIRPLLAANETTLELLHRMDGLERSTYELSYPRGRNMELPEPDALARAGALLLLDLRTALASAAQSSAQPDAERIRRDLGALRSLALSLRLESSWVMQVLARQADRLYLGALRHVLDSDLDPRVLDLDLTLDAGPDGEGGVCPRFQRMLAFEAATTLLPPPTSHELGHWTRLGRVDAGPHGSRYGLLAARTLSDLQRMAAACPKARATGAIWTPTAPILRQERLQHPIYELGLGWRLFLRDEIELWLGRLAATLRTEGLRRGAYPTSLAELPGVDTERYEAIDVTIRAAADGGVELVALADGWDDDRLPRPWKLPPRP